MLFAFFLNGKIPEFPWKKKSKNGQKCSLHFSRQNIRVSRCGHEQVHSIFSKIKEKVTQLRLSDCSELVKRTKFSVNKGQRIKSQSSGLKRAKICKKKLRKRRKGDFYQKRPEKCEKKASLFGLGLHAGLCLKHTRSLLTSKALAVTFANIPGRNRCKLHFFFPGFL